MEREREVVSRFNVHFCVPLIFSSAISAIQALLHILRRLTGFEGHGLCPRSPQPPRDRTANPGRVPAAGTQMFQLDFADPSEGITAQLVETQRRGVKTNTEKKVQLSGRQQVQM